MSLAAALAGGLLLVALLAACGDGGEAEPTATVPQPTPTATPHGRSALPLQRFHYVASLTIKESGAEHEELIIATEGDYQAPNRHAFTYTIQRGEGRLEQSLVMVGPRVWLRRGSQPWRETNRQHPEVADLLAAAFSPARPGFLAGYSFPRLRDAVLDLPAADQSVNGVPALHYQVGPTGQAFLEAYVPNRELAGSARDRTWELWLAREGGWPVRLRATGSIEAGAKVLAELEVQTPASWQLQVDISRPNDPSLRVQAPR